VKLLLATRNEHKRRELSRLLPDYELEPLAEELALPPEEGQTFHENALAKARAVASATGRAALGEDSGIEAAALGGAPGVRSARYASSSDGNASDAENTARLLREAPAGSALRYVCALAYVEPIAAVEQVFTGCCEGRLADSPRGARGFGYDPIFLPEEVADTRTMAELTDPQKDAISHRGEAARALRQWLAAGSANVAARAHGREDLGASSAATPD
jgi:XTP/dITP diphosphohydrolase